MKYLLSSVIILPSLLSALSLTEAVQQTMETNPQIFVKKNILQSEKELLQNSYSGYLPSVDLAYSAGRETTETIANAHKQYTNNIQDASATLTENVFEGFNTMYDVQKQKSLILSADSGVKDAANSIALDVITAYVDILKKKKLQEIAQENVDVHKKYLDQIKEKVDAGVDRKSDYKQTLSRYENAQSSYYLAEQNFKNAITTFQRLLKVDVDADELEKPSVGDLPAEDIDELVAIALKNNPTIHVSEADISTARATLKQSSANYYPKADVQARAYWNKNLNGIQTTQLQPYDEEDGYNVMLKLSYNIFNGLSDRSIKEANRYKLLEKQNVLADSRRYVEAYTKIAWQTFMSTQDQMVHIAKNIEASKQTVADYQQEHDLGRRSIIDLLNIELEYNAARNRMVTTEYDHILAYYQILTYTGKILESMNVSIEQ